MYFEGPPMRAGTDRTRRTIEYFDGRTEFYDYDPELIPMQWQSWLRHSRDEPPTLAELREAEAQRLLTIQRAAELDRKWEERKLELERQRTAALPAATPESSPTAPHGQGDTFEPGAWTPASKRR
ncbi:hypothetical protein SpCBS45565_g04027 [Spizellomyces sp. 'palustris']|nr:hypothetical protein SpCBS45565_g04027 [Spizellomyces sp. 'palustris']